MRLGLAAACMVVIGIGSTAEPTAGPERMLRLAQATVVTPTTPATTSTLPQTSAQSQQVLSCYVNCNSKIGLCQGLCSTTNSPASTFPTASPFVVPPLRPDAGGLTQCFLNCSSQQLACQQACAIH
jgi:hypothetical protein